MRTYLKLLRLPYQFQLGPIFLWGFWLGGGTFDSWREFARFVAIFLIFHVGAFGGLTALNSFYDRDETPIGGLWNPPRVPQHLGIFAWVVQLGGLLFLLPFGVVLCAIYAALLVLSLLYSHPKPRGKGHPFGSLCIVALGQGVLDCIAGAFANSSTRLSFAFVLGTLGATLTVAAFFPLTQLYQARDDHENGDQTLALWLLDRGGRAAVFGWSQAWSALGTLSNALALWQWHHPREAVLLLLAGVFPLLFMSQWKSSTRSKTNCTREDFRRVHFLMRAMATVFGAFVAWKLTFV